MKTTVEDSGWHREASVWVHTEMVVAEFLTIWDQSGRSHDDWLMYRAGIAALFHDFGKPEAEEPRINKEGVAYRRYAGHESVSATEFRMLATGSGWMELFGSEPELEADDLFVIAFMIQHHLPYSYLHPLRLAVTQTAWQFNEHDLFPFFALLRADARGRISDDHFTKLANVEAWINETTSLFVEPMVRVPGADKYAIVLIGPSGAGKSSHLSKLPAGTEIYSMDALRLEHYGDDSITDPVAHYTAAWQAANADSAFRQITTARIHVVAKSSADYVVADNTNLSKKARREFIAAAKQAGRVVIGVCFITVSLGELVERGQRRGDRGVPLGTITNMFRSMYLPGFDEVDVVHVI